MGTYAFILPLDSPAANSPAVGGKGAKLARMARKGFPVPPGFFITVEAYSAFIRANCLASQILEYARSGNAFERASRAIRCLFEKGNIPGPVSADICQAYSELTQRVGLRSDSGEIRASVLVRSHSLSVAVRSSAKDEDSPDASSAGQYETYLNVCGSDALMRAVKLCWSSLWTARGLAYRAHRHVEPAEAGLAVVVQQMVPADAAGILFTINPLTGCRDEIVINATWGLGEAVVSGQVAPDTVVVDKTSSMVKYSEIGDKEAMVVLTSDGVAMAPVDPLYHSRFALTNEQVNTLARLGRDIETHFGGPQDIEWAIAAGQAFILQARPVTALPGHVGEPVDAGVRVPGDDDWPTLGESLPSQPFDLWTQVNVGEVFPFPVSPLTWSGIPHMINTAGRQTIRGLRVCYVDRIQSAKRFYGRVYFNEGAFGYVLSEEFGLPTSFHDTAFGTRARVFQKHHHGLRVVRFLRRLPYAMVIAGRQINTDKELEAVFPEVDGWVAEFKQRELERLSDHELWKDVTLVWRERTSRVFNLHAQMGSAALTAFSVLERLLDRWCGRKEVTHDLVTGLSGVYAAEMGPALWHIAQALRQLGLEALLDGHPSAALGQLQKYPAAKPVLRMLDAFLERHGHRCPGEGEWLRPRWAEAPEQVIELLSGYRRAGDKGNPVEAEARQRRRREEATVWVEAHLGFVRRAVFRKFLRKVQCIVRLRDNSKHYLMKLAFPTCCIYRTLARRWVDRDWLNQIDDFYFLTIPEIEAIIEADDPCAITDDLSRLIRDRRCAYEYWFKIQPPEVIGPDGQARPAIAVRHAAQAILQGIPVSSGQATGSARVVLTLREAGCLGSSDILVTRATDPGWTPVFPLVAGLVLEVGGQLSHGAIVAREYGVPAVVNVKDAMRRIRDGQSITVNGSNGQVQLHA